MCLLRKLFEQNYNGKTDSLKNAKNEEIKEDEIDDLELDEILDD